MSYYTGDQQQQQWHQHSQTTNYNTTSPTYPPQNGTQANGQQRTPIGPVLNQAVGNIMSDLKANLDKDYFKTTCGMLNGIEVIASLIIFIIASNLHGYSFLTLISGFAFWISLLFLLINLFQIPEKIPAVPWLRAQIGFLAIAAILFTLNAFYILFFNFVLCLLVLHLAVLYGYHTYDKLKEHGRIISEQFQQQVNPQQSTNLNV